MRSILNGDKNNIEVHGDEIRIRNSLSEGGTGINAYKVGVVPIISNVQVALGEKFSIFKKALEISRAPLALKETPLNKNVTSFRILRLATGKVAERMLANILVCDDIIIGVEYNTNLIYDKDFRRYVRLSALQILNLGKPGSNNLLFATKSLSALLKVKRESLIVIESPKNIIIKVKCNNRLSLDIQYTATLNKQCEFRMSFISFNINDAIKKIKQMQN